MKQTIVRVARASDLEEVLDLLGYLHPQDASPDPAKAQAAWSAMLGSGLITSLVAEIGGSLVSSCTLAILPNLTRAARPYGVIENVVTHPNYRRQGLGHAVLSAALEAAWAVDCYKVMLATGSHRPEILQFYESAGFTRGKTAFQARRA